MWLSGEIPRQPFCIHLNPYKQRHNASGKFCFKKSKVEWQRLEQILRIQKSL